MHPVAAADGSLLALYRRADEGVENGRCVATSRAAGAESFGRPLTLGGFCLDAVTYARRSVAALISRPRGRYDTLNVAFGTTAPRFGKPVLVTRSRRTRRTSLAATSSGLVAVAWFVDRGARNDRVYVRLRRKGRRFARAIRIAQDRVRNVAVAVGRRGEVLVAWEARGKVRARLRRAGRRRFDRTETIRSLDAFNAEIRAAVTDSGRAILAWSSQFRSEGGAHGDKITQVAVRGSGTRRFRKAQLLERDSSGSIELGNLRLASGSRPFVAWTGREGLNDVVRVSEADEKAVFGAPVVVSEPTENSYVTSAARGPLGDAAVLWMRDYDAPSAVFGAYRRAGAARFEAPESLSTGHDARFGSLVFDPINGRATALWDENFGVGSDRIRRILAATRSR